MKQRPVQPELPHPANGLQPQRFSDPPPRRTAHTRGGRHAVHDHERNHDDVHANALLPVAWLDRGPRTWRASSSVTSASRPWTEPCTGSLATPVFFVARTDSERQKARGVARGAGEHVVGHAASAMGRRAEPEHVPASASGRFTRHRARARPQPRAKVEAPAHVRASARTVPSNHVCIRQDPWRRQETNHAPPPSSDKTRGGAGTAAPSAQPTVAITQRSIP